MEDATAWRGKDIPVTLEQLAILVDAKNEAGKSEVTRVCGFAEATAECIVFAADQKALSVALASAAGVILAVDTLSVCDDPRVLYVRDARYAFALAAAHLQAHVMQGNIHTTAVLGADVVIGTGTIVGPYAVVGDGAVLGAFCVIEAHVTVHHGTIVGDRVIVQAGTVLGSTGFGYARNRDTGAYLLFPQQGTLVIEDNVEIGANTTIDRGALGETRIGRGTKIDNLVHIGHNCVIGRNVIIAAQTGISGSSVIEDGAILGGQVGIGEHATVGSGVILGGGAGVLSGKKMHGPGQVFWGRPARPLKEYLRDLARLRSGRTKE